jgi:hypothetical protein
VCNFSMVVAESAQVDAAAGGRFYGMVRAEDVWFVLRERQVVRKQCVNTLSGVAVAQARNSASPSLALCVSVRIESAVAAGGRFE